MALQLTSRLQGSLYRPSVALLQARPVSSSNGRFATGEKMTKVDIDNRAVRDQLGKIQMEYVRKAEETSMFSASEHKKFRRKDVRTAAICVAAVVSIYAYTIYAIKQETFLDDFEMPDPMDDPNTSQPQRIDAIATRRA